MFEGMRREHETQIEELRQQVVTAIGNEKLKREAERYVVNCVEKFGQNSSKTCLNKTS